MNVKIQQGREEINLIIGIYLIGGQFNSMRSLKKADLMHTSKVKAVKFNAENYAQLYKI